jgi:hypothetical protein
VQNEVIYKRTKPKKVNTMSKKEECAPCVKKVNDLIANSAGVYTEEHREWLESMEEKHLDTLLAANKQKEVVKEVNVLSAEDKAALEFGKNQLKERRDKMIKGIQDNTEKDLWPLETLNSLDDQTLSKIHKSVYKETVDFSLNSNFGMQINRKTVDTGEPLYPAGVIIEN